MEKVRKVLVVEDDPEIVEYLSSFIPLLGPYEVAQAGNELEALANINAFEPELIILDLRMPKIDGRTFLKEVEKKHQKTKVLVLITEAAEEKEFAREGRFEVISKSLDLTELSERVKRLLPPDERRREKREYARLLVVDDEPEINEFLKNDLFEPLGIKVFTAHDGEEALQIFKKEGCNLAIIDLKMPKVGGRDLLRSLERSTDPPKPKVIILITSALGDAVEEIKRLGYPILLKPMDLTKLEKSILQACEKFSLALKK